MDSFCDLVPPRELDATRDGAFGIYRREGELSLSWAWQVYMVGNHMLPLVISWSPESSRSADWFWDSKWHRLVDHLFSTLADVSSLTGVAYVSNIAVAPRARGRGVARMLMEEAHRVAGKWGCR